MTKATVTKFFIRGALAATAGGILAICAVWIGRESAFTLPVIGLGLVGALAVAAGLIAGLASWIGALLNVSQLESKTWFVVLLLLGIVNLGIFGMIAYVMVGPDGTTPKAGGNG